MDRQVSTSFTEVDLEKVAPILEGKLECLPPISSRLVRVFVSSTFSDMVDERNALMEQLYPRLKDFCRDKYGLEFQIMDLRWGIRDEAQDDHNTIEFCIREIENCKRSSIGPSCLVLVGQKYGYRPFPPKIMAEEFVLIRQALEETEENVDILDEWFREEENVVPPMYCLLPISSVLVHYFNRHEPILQSRDRRRWIDIFDNLRNLLRQGVKLCVEKGQLSKDELDKYFISVTEYEIVKAAPSSEYCNKHCVGMIRTITNLEEHVSHPKAHRFLDLIPSTKEPDKEAEELLNVLREDKIKEIFKESDNLALFDLTWLEDNRKAPNSDPLYLEQFCNDLYKRLTSLITRAICEIENLDWHRGKVSDTFVVEVIQHLSMCKSRCAVFRGRSQTLERVRQYICSDNPQALVIYGESGSGKTSVVAKATSLVHQWCFGVQPIVVCRFLGTSARSTSIRLALGSICWQIAVLNGLDITDIPADYPSLVTYFHEVLKMGKKEKPLVIFMDSLDQLTTSHKAHNLIWLPQTLPPHTRLIISTLPEEYDLLKSLKQVITNENNFIQVYPLGQTVGIKLIQDWLMRENRKLTHDQFAVVEEALRMCSLPLYARLVFNEICRWKSYDPLDKTKVAHTVKGVINTLFDRVEHQHGEKFTSHALAYITASRNGLSEAELEDVMSLDDVVLNDVYIHWVPPIRRIPPLLWPRLYEDLSSYIVQREANGILVYWWYHRQFISVSSQRYLSKKGQQKYIHSVLADYFLGKWGGGKKKPYTFTLRNKENVDLEGYMFQSEADRKVPVQPLWFGSSLPFPYKGKILYNLRKLAEMPYHLMMAGRYEDLKCEVLFNYTWLHTKLSATSLHDILSDFVTADESGMDPDPEFQLVLNTLRVGGSYVNQNPDTLAFDLVGRLLPFYDEFPNIRSLLQQCDAESREHSALVPVFHSYESPSEVLLYILEEHVKVVLWLTFSPHTNELISVSRDGTIAFWDTIRGERSRVIDISSLNPGPRTRIMLSENGEYLVCDSDQTDSAAHVFNLKTGQKVHECGQKIPTQNRSFVINNLMVRQKTIFNLKTGEDIASLDEFTRSRQYVTVAITHNEKYILIGERDMTNMFALHSRQLLMSFPGSNVPSKFLLSMDDSLLYVGYSVDCLFKVIDVDPKSDTFGDLILQYDYRIALEGRKLRTGSSYSQELTEISICQEDSNLVLLNIQRCNLVVLNMATRESYLMSMDSFESDSDLFLFGSTFSYDGKYVIAGYNRDLHIWETAYGRHISAIHIHSVYRFPFSVSRTSNLVATGSNIHTAIKLWDLDKLTTREPSQLKIYENPVNAVTIAREARFLFVKQFYPLSSVRGYKFIHSFGIDVWNLSTGECREFLPFDQFGEMIQMDVSPDAHQMVLLLSSREEQYIAIINMQLGSIGDLVYHHGCRSFVINDGRHFMATAAINHEADPEVKLWSLPNGQELFHIKEATHPIFFHSSSMLACVVNCDSITTYQPHYFLQDNFKTGDINKMQVVPCHEGMLLLTTFSIIQGLSAKVVMFDVNKNKEVITFKDVAPNGFLDFSKDGTVGIDGYLNIYNMWTGEIKLKIKGESFGDDMEYEDPYEHVRLTYDGYYAIWVEGLAMKACRINDCHIIAGMSTHESVITMTDLDYGYYIVIGREDGHVICMKLLDPQVESPLDTPSVSLDERRENLINFIPLKKDVNEFEGFYKVAPSVCSDDELPHAAPSVVNILTEKIKVPHAVIYPVRWRTFSECESPPSRSRPESPNPPVSQRARAQSVAGSTHRSSLHDLLSPTNILRTTSSFFMSFGSQESLQQNHDDHHFYPK